MAPDEKKPGRPREGTDADAIAKRAAEVAREVAAAAREAVAAVAREAAADASEAVATVVDAVTPDAPLPTSRPELMALHRQARKRRDAAPLLSHQRAQAMEELGRIEVQIARIERAADPPLL